MRRARLARRRPIAAAQGNRLVQTARIDALRAPIPDIGSEVVVLQDFSQTVLRAGVRWRSRRAIALLAALAVSARVILFPQMPPAPGYPLYSGRVDWFEHGPDGIAGLIARALWGAIAPLSSGEGA